MASSKKARNGGAAKPAKKRVARRKTVRNGTSPRTIAQAEVDAQARLAAIVHSSEDAIVSKDLNGIVTSWNRGAQRLFGYTAEEAIGRPITLIIPQERFNEETTILQRIRNGEAVEHYETMRMRKDGSLVDISLSVSPIRDNTGRVIGASKIARDVSDRRRADEALRNRERLQRLLADISMAGTSVVPVDPVQLEKRLQPICEKIAAELGASRCGFASINMETGEAVVKHEAHGDLCSMQGTYPLSQSTPLFLAHGLAGRTTVLDDMSTDPLTAEEYSRRHKKQHIRAIITVPLHRHGRWVANMWVSSHEPRHWTKGDVELVETLADRMWAFMEQARFASVAQEGARQQEALYQFANRLQHTTSADDIYQAALDAICGALKCDRASILMVDDDGIMRFVGWRDLSDRYRKAVEGHSPWKRDTQNPEPIYVNDIAIAYLEDRLKQVIKSEGIAALGFIPLISDGKLIGKFMTYYNAPHVFRRSELDLGLTIGRHLAFAIERKRAEEMLRQSERQTTADLEAAMRLYDVGKKCSDVSSCPTECLQAILDAAIGIMGADKGNIHVLNPESGTLSIAVHRGFDAPFLKFFSNVHTNDAAACGKAMSKMERVIIENVAQSEVFTGKKSLSVLLEAGVQAVQSTPLSSTAGSILGMISTHFNAPHRPNDRELRFMDLLARQAADYLERKRAEEALQRAKGEAEEASRAKDQFLAMLSHELRTPLTPVLMAATALELEGNVSEEIREQLAMMRRNIELEARLIDDLLDITRIAHGKFELHEELVDVHAALNHALKISESGILAKRLQVGKNFSAVQHYCRADAARLQEVFWNVLRNAVKFTPAGGQIDISTHNDGEQVVVEISDNGIGIDPEIQPRIFDAFAQGEPDIRARFGGLGLGLAISKRIIDLHRGTIEVRSAGRDQGSAFIIKIASAARPPLEVPSRAPVPIAASGPAEILIVEDHEDTVRVFSRILRTAGYAVTACGSLEEARDAAARQKFDLVISDLGLPDGSGLDLMRHLRATQQITGIALSGFGTAADVEESEAAGFATHLTKPVDVTRLHFVIASLLNDGRVESNVATTN